MCVASLLAPLVGTAFAGTAATALTVGLVTAGASALMAPKPSTPEYKAADPPTPPPTSVSSTESESAVTSQRRLDALRAGFAATQRTGAAGVTSSPAVIKPGVTGKKGLLGQ